MTIPVLRDYQECGVAEIRGRFPAYRRVLYVAPTGSGKTIIFAFVVERAAVKGNRCIIITHRGEIADQIGAALSAFGVPHGRIQPGYPEEPEATIQVAMVVTLGRRITHIAEPQVLVVDEAHHAVSHTWQSVFEHWTQAKVLGVTATPERLDGRGLRECFDTMVTGPSVRDLIDRGFLAAFKCLSPPMRIDLSRVRSTAGDYRSDELADAMDQPVITGDCIDHYRNHLHGRTAIAFCVTCAHADHVAGAFRGAGIAAASIDGRMNREQRDALLNGLRCGGLKVLTSCELISEGFDAPAVGGAILLRPTQSLGLYLQQVGRSLRPKPDGSPAVILDHVGSVHTHGLPDAERHWSLDARARRERGAVSAMAVPGAGGTRDAPNEEAGELEEVIACPAWAGGFDLRDRRPGMLRRLIRLAGRDEARLRTIQRTRGYRAGVGLARAARRRTGGMATMIGGELTLFNKHAAVSSDDSWLTKVIKLVDGKVVSDGAACVMSRGAAKRLPIASEAEFAGVIAGLSPSQAISLGRLRPDLPAEVAVIVQRKLNGQAGTIARSRDFLCYHRGAPAYALIDYDRKNMPAAVADRITAAGGFWSALTAVCPALAGSERVSRASTSNGLYHLQTGEQYPGSGGEHVYVAVRDGDDIERFLCALHDRCWLAGLGWFDVGAAGQLLDRSLVDHTVGSPERLVFEGGPVVHAPLAQDRAARIPKAIPGDAIDTRAACPQLLDFEREQLAELRRADRHRVAERASIARAAFIGAQAARLVDRHGLPPAAARRMAEAQIGGTLLPFVALPWDDPDLEGATVADVLADPDRFMGATLADPLEGVPYGRGVAIVMQRPDGGLWIHSFAHGRTIYQLRYDAQAVEAAIRAAPKDARVDTFLQLLLVATLEPDEETRLRDLVCQLAGVKVRPLDKRIKETKQRQARERATAERSRRAAERTDPRPRRPAPAIDDERLPILRDLDAILCAAAEPEPPMRDVEGRMVEVTVRRPAGLHALTAAGSDTDAEDTRLPPPEMPLLTRHTDKTAAHLIEQHVEYAETTDTDERTVALHPIFIPHYMQFRASRLPIVRGIVTAPLVLPDGRLLVKHGLDRAEQLVYRIDPRLIATVPQPAMITTRRILNATRFLLEHWLVDVTAGFAGKMILVAASLSIIERVLLPERPAFFITAGRRGGGKTTAIMMAVAAVTGRLPPAAAWSLSEEERRKALFAYLCQAIDVLVWDNVPRGLAISCPSIEKSLTAPTYSDRILGESLFRVVPSTTVQLFDGNSITPTGDLASRSLSVWLDVTRPDPENRDVTHIDPMGWTFAHRGQIVRALYTILLGNPRLAGGKQADPKTRFRTWWHLVGAALEHAASLLVNERDTLRPADRKPAHAVAEPLDFVEQFRVFEDNDDSGNALAGLLQALDALWPRGMYPDGFRADQVAERMLDNGLGLDAVALELRGLLDAVGARPMNVVTGHSVGNRLRHVLDNPAVAGNEVLILRKRAARGGKHLPSVYLIERRKP